MQIRDRFLHGLKWSAIGKLLSQLLSWGSTIVVMRLLQTSDYGLMAMTMMVITLLSNLNEFGFGSALVRGETLDRRTCGAVFGAMLVVATALNGALWLGAAPLAHFFNDPRLAELLRPAGLIFLISALSTVPESVLRREMDFKAIAYADIAAVIATSLSALGLAYAGKGVWALLLGNLVGAAVRTLLLHLQSHTRVWPNADFQQLRGLLSYGSNLTASRFTWWFMSQVDVLIGAKLLSTAALGLYSVALTLASLPLQKSMQVVNQVAFSAIAKLKNSGQAVPPELLRGLRALNLASLPSCALLALLAQPLVLLVIGQQWADAVLALQLIALAVPLRLCSAILATALIATGHAGADFRNTLTGALVMPLAFAVGGMLWGANGLAAAWTVGVPLVFLLNFPRSARLLDLPLRPVLGTFRNGLLACLPMVGVVMGAGRLVPAQPLWQLLVPGTLGVLSYVLALFVLDRAFRQWLQAQLASRLNKDS
ncbi:lipopolysaccharide biosynthesis protein [Mitsuaria sp. WAJ17]|uniref:lipopolysaccharide biosynthesis protein n=1 Tax=Mitsuaria sp. WAJ17 TaxID=2761452 RepID=UPI0016039C1D|nr:lipopolysaccharide biosynthesis protein [Mitsuaria sp. WAJ17]MBB2486231.1 lipopolysaccharide biosynthesis protein [Mitsuaria sp. WAJ17]